MKFHLNPLPTGMRTLSSSEATCSVNGQEGAVYLYQSLDVIKDTTKQTTKLIVLAMGIAIILTTIFAFFLSTRITSPLRKMREAAFEVAKGKFDTKVPILTKDEIGELATGFNQMGRQLKFHINALNQEKEQLSSILSSMADGVITFNRDGTILITNPPADRFLQQWYYEHGSNEGEAIPTIVKELLQSVVVTAMEQTDEIRLQGRSYVVIVSPLYNNNTIRGAVAVVRDMTEERRLDKLRKDFIANVSHELRTPISMLQGTVKRLWMISRRLKKRKKKLPASSMMSRSGWEGWSMIYSILQGWKRGISPFKNNPSVSCRLRKGWPTSSWAGQRKEDLHPL